MKKILILIALLGLITLDSYGQCTITIGNEVYNTTCFEILTKLKEPQRAPKLSLGIEVSIVDKNCGKVVIKGGSRNFGDATIYLDGRSTIKLIDRNNDWSIDYENYKMYNLTCSELELLKSNNIKLIRFSISDAFHENTFEQYYNTSYSYYFDMEKSFAERINFPKMIRKVFGY